MLDIVINSFIFDVNGGGHDVTSCLVAKVPASEPPIPKAAMFISTSSQHLGSMSVTSRHAR